ncbi:MULTISPECIES: hypothetical protein [Enterobacter]|uniref:hypothetical protein n=1 Tax=Enterobacter TaxID=547 RepID=UPI0018CDF66D|nr:MULTISPECIES: hypothetical protein [Enterobacter]MBH0128592.1 hypothetical protein [Enterobacter sp. SECR18-0236]
MVYFALPVCQLFQQGTVQRFLFGKALFQQKDVVRRGVVSENGIYGHSRFCNTDFDDKLACLNLSGV